MRDVPILLVHARALHVVPLIDGAVGVAQPLGVGVDRCLCALVGQPRAHPVREAIFGHDIEVMSHSYAFREHARHYDRKEGLPGDGPEPEDQKLRRICEYIWPQRSRDGYSVVELLQFLIYGSDPAEAEFRLWSALRDDKWRLPHLGKSTLGELIGWARPDAYPPRNNRNNLALRALGYDVETVA